MSLLDNAGGKTVKDIEQNLVPELEAGEKAVIDYAVNALKNLLAGKRIVISLEDK